MVQSTQIFGKKVYAFPSMKEVTAYVKGKKKILIALNAEKIINKDERLVSLMNENICYPDGIGVILALRMKGIRSRRLPGADLWLQLVNDLHETESFYFVGSTQEVITETVQKIKEKYPAINIVKYRNGYLSNDNVLELKKDLLEKKPSVVFVAMGSPKQEYLMADLIKTHPALYMGLGGSFDVFTGLKKRAPVIFQKLGLEWFFRLTHEPVRAKRQVALLKFLTLLLSKKFD